MSSRNSDQEGARARAEARFQKTSEREREAAKVWQEHDVEVKATAQRMAHLRALRLAKESSETTPAQVEAAAESEKRRQALLSIGKPPAAPKPKRVRKAADPVIRAAN